MPYRRTGYRRNNRRRRPYRRTTVGAPLGRMPRWGRSMRVAQNLTRNVFWFKSTGPVEVLGNGTINLSANASQVSGTQAFQNFARSFEQYKVLKVVLKLIPASVGSESISTTWFHRGNAVTWVDQPPLQTNPPAGINQVMSLPSARLFQPRRFHKRYMNRPKGGLTNLWGTIQHTAGVPIIGPDSWLTTIKLYGDNFGPGPGPQGQTIPPYFFFEQYFKVVFRSRFTS